MTWKTFVLRLVTQLCEARACRSFSLAQFGAFAELPLAGFAPNNFHRAAKLRQTLQFLRDDGLIGFKDGHGNYTLLGQTILAGEVEEDALPLLRAFQGEPQKREYLIEVYARDQGLVKQAKQLFGFKCLCFGCANSFEKEDKSLYCEVHHIRPLCEHGEDVLSNLSVLCAHHHRMAHFASEKEQGELREFLLERTTKVLSSTLTTPLPPLAPRP